MEAYKGYAAQVIPKIDAEIAEKGHFWMGTSSILSSAASSMVRKKLSIGEGKLWTS